MFCLELSEGHRELRDWVHGFATDVIRPAAAEWDEREKTPWPILQEAAKTGLYGPETLAGFWADETGLSPPIAHEELFWGDGGIGMTIFGTTLAVAAIFTTGTADQLAEWLPQCYGDAGEPQVAAFCSAQPHAGSDVSAMHHIRAVYHEASDEWILTGQSTWATNGGIAAVYVVHAVVDASLGSRGQAVFVIPVGTCGLQAGRPHRKHGLRAANAADVFFDDVRIPGANLLGGPERLVERLIRTREKRGRGGQAAIRTFELSQSIVAAQAVGIARAAYEYALDYAKQEVVSGRPIIENQSIAFTLADMKTEIDAARLLVWRAAWMGKTGEKFTAGEGSMSKLKAGRVAMWATERAVQILGGASYSREYPVERMHRDAEIYGIFEGTEQIQQLVIARAISGLPIR
ncbi:MAG: acyl-CoA dehydrogenase family protein [Pseudonocardiaceae bacterium]